MALYRSCSFFNFIKNQNQSLVLSKTVRKNVFVTPVLINSHRHLFWEKDRKGGYETSENISNFEHLKKGFKELKHEVKLFSQEVKELWESDPILIARPVKCSIYNIQGTFPPCGIPVGRPVEWVLQASKYLYDKNKIKMFVSKQNSDFKRT